MTDLPLSAPDRRVPLGVALRAVGAVVIALVAAVALGACVSVLTGCSSDEAASMGSGVEAAVEGAATDESGVLVVASALNSEPYEQATSTSQIGFTVELLELVGEQAGLDVQFAKAVSHKDADQNITPGRPEDVAAKVAAGDADLGASSIPADAALEGVSLSDPYLHADYTVLTKMDAGYDDLASIQGADTVVAVQDDAAVAAWVAENLPEAEVVVFEDGVEALMELNSERAQAAIVDEPRFRRYVQVKEPHLQAVETIASDKDYAFAVAAGNEALLTTVNEALAALRADGSYDALYDSWFGDADIVNEAAASREKGTGNAPEAVQDSTGA
ncbi:transporter substrate-binding domain-containing protein [Enterorhabdus sp. NM05_H27]|nr:transporter substrate-binding domain-containing protein [Enterorhabdus sp. NM05_H27]